MRLLAFFKYLALAATAILTALLLSVWLSPPDAHVCDDDDCGCPSAEDALSEGTPYLLSHKKDLVAWMPWGDAAFERARLENKPVLLSSGFVACRWDRIMQKESFRDPEIAAFINRHFVPVKLDRDERPNVDMFYVTFVQATTGTAGWPLTVVLTPKGYPFFGGCYFPPKDTYGSVGLKTILEDVLRRWTQNRPSIEASAKEMFNVMMRQGSAQRGELRAPEAFDWSVLSAAVNAFDPQRGGFSKAPPRQPQAALLAFLLEYAATYPDQCKGAQARDMATFTLNCMARSALQDQLGGGFFSYTADMDWRRPRFTKELDVQAQLGGLYLAAWRQTQNAYFKAVGKETLDYVCRELSSPCGLFFSGQGEPPSSDPMKNDYYLWTPPQIDVLLPPDPARIFKLHFGLEGVFAPVPLTQETPLEETSVRLGLTPEDVRSSLESSANIVRMARARRPAPVCDEKAVTSENALMISALAQGAKLTGNPNYLLRASRAAEAVRQYLSTDEDRLKRIYAASTQSTAPALLEDYAFMIAALLDLHAASDAPLAKEKWLTWAQALQKTQDDLFWDKKEGGYFTSPAPALTGIPRIKRAMDAHLPCANAVSALNLQRLSRLTSDSAYARRAQALLSAASFFRSSAPLADATWATALRRQSLIEQKRD